MSKKKKKKKTGYIVNNIPVDGKSADMAMKFAFSNLGFNLSSFFGYTPLEGKGGPDLNEYVDKSKENVVIGSLDTLPDLSKVPSQNETLYIRRPGTATFKDVVDMDASKDVNIKRTYVFLTKKKQAKSVLTFDSKSYFIRSILLYSSLLPTYNEIKDQWNAQIEQKNDGVDVMLIPDVYVYSENPIYINILVLAVPDFKGSTHYNDGVITEDFKEYLTNLVSSIATASIKTECDRLAIDPFAGLKVLEKNAYDIGPVYYEIFNNEPCTKMIPDIIYAIADDVLYNIFLS